MRVSRVEFFNAVQNFLLSKYSLSNEDINTFLSEYSENYTDVNKILQALLKTSQFIHINGKFYRKPLFKRMTN
jgi:hypothetical protein